MRADENPTSKSADWFWRLAPRLGPWLIAGALLLVLSPMFNELGGLVPYLLVAAAGMGAVVSLHPLIFFTFYFGALFFHDTVLPGFGVSANQVFALAFLGSFASFWARGRAVRLESGWLPVLAVATLYYALSAATGESVERGLVHMRYTVIYFVLAVCVAKCLASERAILALAWIVAGTTFLAACHGFAEAVEKGVFGALTGRWTNAVRVTGTAKNPIVFGWNMVYAVPFAFLLYSELRSATWRWVALFFGLSAVAVAALTFNRQTFILIGLVVGLSALLFRFRNRKAVLTAVAALGGLGAVTILPNVVRRMMTVTTMSRDPSFLERRDSFLIGTEMFDQHPVFGIGLGSFPAVWKNYLPEDYSTFYSQYMEPTRERYPDFGYMQLLVETGVVGLALFLVLIATAARRAWRLRRLAEAREDWFLANVCSLVLVLLTFVAATTAIQDTLLYVRIWVLFAFVLLCDPRMWVRESEA